MSKNEARTAGDGPVAPAGLNHLVLNVRDMEQSHHFWTEMLGFRHVGTFHKTEKLRDPRPMRFYSGDHGGRLNHHDIALVENPALPAPDETGAPPCAINHIAITLPDRESWLRQLRYLQASGVPFERRVNHGMTHSLYIRDPNGYGIELVYDLPREIWEGDIDGALNWYRVLPNEGEAALHDEVENVPVFGDPNRPVAAEASE